MAEVASEEVRPQIRELAKWDMYAKATESQQRSSRLAWSIRDGNPRITVFTNINEDPVGNKMIYAAFNPATFMIFLNLFNRLAKGEPGRSSYITCYTSFKPNGAANQGPAEKTLLSTVYFGKDELGIVYLKLVAANRPEIKFEYHLSDYHEIFKPDGEPLTQAEASQAQGTTTIETLIRIYEHLVAEFKPARTPQATDRAYMPNSNNYANTKTSDVTFDNDIGF